MNQRVSDVLAGLIVRYGPELANDPRRTEALLRDLCGEYRREISVLVAAQEEGIPAELAASASSTPGSLLFSRLYLKLKSDRGLSTEAAQWAVQTWAHALQLRGMADVSHSLAVAVDDAEEDVAAQFQALTSQMSESQAVLPTPVHVPRADTPAAGRETVTSGSGFPVIPHVPDRCPRCGGEPVRQIGHSVDDPKGGFPGWALVITIPIGLFWIWLGLSTLDEPLTAVLLVGLGVFGFILGPIRKVQQSKKSAPRERLVCSSCGHQWP